MSIRILALLRLRMFWAVVLAAFASTVGAQVKATFFADYPATPNPLGPYLGGSVLCSASTYGTASGGFNLDFNDVATRSTLCPSNPDILSPYLNNQLGARFTGSLIVASAGTYDVVLSSDDGDALAIDGVLVRMDWYAKSGGPGTIQVALDAGANPFVFDYFQGPCCQAFAELQPGDGVTITPPPAVTNPTVPEPAAITLMAAGVSLGGFGAWRRRRRERLLAAACDLRFRGRAPRRPIAAHGSHDQER